MDNDSNDENMVYIIKTNLGYVIKVPANEAMFYDTIYALQETGWISKAAFLTAETQMINYAYDKID